ncbi:hypothetical protein AKJ66_01050 [candidate division MSBL1 archaeon SCGC-AAA259E22]|uniref:Uncharacterized protein n=1 Tax=candidate division MSBL1 archaeon SCGC-AAA259E22 TaxID=1698265 RepID=A0A133UHZ2_9EURY|nr:hypothetical protein AKJ66_01050 [candidate division MSBL1 archaeon SCGC-AAA259E22]
MEVIEPEKEIRESKLPNLSGVGRVKITRYRCDKCEKEFEETERNEEVAPDVSAREYFWSLGYRESEN